jgi:predicted GNAT family acetyltransferase
MASFRLEPLHAEDMDAFVRLYYTCFSPIFDVFYHRTPSDEGFKVMAAERTKGIQPPEVHAFKLTDPASGTLIGAARWEVYEKARTEEQLRAELEYVQTFAPEQNGEAFTFMRHSLEKIGQKIMGTKPHIHLSVIFVSPAYRGTGAARALMEWGLNEADR